MNIYLVTEESLSIPNIKLILKKQFIKSVDTYLFGSKIIITQSDANTYEIGGVASRNYNKFYMKIAKGNTSFVDVLVYESENPADLLTKRPSSAWEITKNLPNSSESGNMTSQRLCKFPFIKYRWGEEVDCKYLIDYLRDIKDADVNKSNERSFALLSAMGVEIFFSNVSSDECRRYIPKQRVISIGDLYYSGKTNKVYDKNNAVNIETNLWNNKKHKRGEHDPNKGWLGAMVFLFRKAGYTGKIIVHSNRPLGYFKDNDNKITKILNRENVTVRYQGNSFKMNKPKELGPRITKHQHVITK